MIEWFLFIILWILRIILGKRAFIEYLQKKLTEKAIKKNYPVTSFVHAVDITELINEIKKGGNKAPDKVIEIYESIKEDLECSFKQEHTKEAYAKFILIVVIKHGASNPNLCAHCAKEVKKIKLSSESRESYSRIRQINERIKRGEKVTELFFVAYVEGWSWIT